ncbi:hypothetical protein [Rubrivirga marina]|uniref:hypothetical protein n=1 Tax=Rubrivirga marina TaxID=1196024 RepID=UPI0015C80039|nr:hypothetical protein [Rubrivirga marina]
MPTSPHLGDGASTRPLPPGELVVEVLPASAVAPSPRLQLYLEHVPAGFLYPADD